MTLGELLEQVGGDARTAARLAKQYPLSYFLLGLELNEIEKILSEWVGEKEGKVVPFKPKAVEIETKEEKEEEEEEVEESGEEEEELDFGEEAEAESEDFDFDFGEDEEEELEEEEEPEEEPAPRGRGRKSSGVKRGRKRGGRR